MVTRLLDLNMIEPRDVNYEDYAILYKTKFNTLLEEHITLEAKYMVLMEYANKLKKELEKQK